MSRSLFKKVVRTKFCGQCACGGGTRWTERVKSTRYANKTLRKIEKI